MDWTRVESYVRHPTRLPRATVPFVVTGLALALVGYLVYAGCGTFACRCDRAYPGDGYTQLLCVQALSEGLMLPEPPTP